MPGRVELTNRALQALGTRSTIASMSEGSNESNNASMVYDSTRQELIRTAPWNFASATATLSLLKAAPGTTQTPMFPATGTWSGAYPPPGWTFEYAYPEDCLRIRKVVPNWSQPTGNDGVPMFPSPAASPMPFWDMPGVRFQVTTDQDENGNSMTVILCNSDQAIGCYMRDITVEDLFDPLFTEALVYALAGKLANSLTGDKTLMRDMFTVADQRIMEARASDANEGITVLQADADWITMGHGIRWPQTGFGSYAYPYGSLFGV